jgi:hypothetical protein
MQEWHGPISFRLKHVACNSYQAHTTCQEKHLLAKARLYVDPFYKRKIKLYELHFNMQHILSSGKLGLHLEHSSLST